MTPTTYELWNGDIARSLIPWAVAAGALIVALLSGERTNTWKHRYKAKTAEIAELTAALADARFQRSARQQPVPLPVWVDPAEVPPRRRHWHIRLMWPGLTPLQVPYSYGDPLDPVRLQVDPCLTPSMTERALHAWLAEDQVQSWPPLDTEGLMVARLITEVEALDTREMEALADA